MAKPYLFLIRGLPGSGKTTLAATMETAFFQWTTVDHFEADQFMLDEGGNYKFDPNKLAYAHAECQKLTRMALQANVHIVIVSNTFVQRWEMRPYAEMAKKYDYQLVITEVRGTYKSVHNVPEATIQNMRDRWEDA